jgi:hypothetical protein
VVFGKRASWAKVLHLSRLLGPIRGRPDKPGRSTSEIKDYDDLVGKVNARFSGVTEDALDDPQTIVDEIHALATGESQKFRTLVGQMA